MRTFWNGSRETKAECTGIGASYLSEIERGHKRGSASALFRIAAAFKTTVDALTYE